MKLMLNLDISSEVKISYNDKIILIGSCFTQEIGDRLNRLKFNVLQNPNGIVYDPISISRSVLSYIDGKIYNEDDLFYHNEIWHSWQHHSQFSGTDKQAALKRINDSQHLAHEFLKNAKWLVLTLGTAFHYKLANNNEPVANCHKCQSSSFIKTMLTANEINNSFSEMLQRLQSFNPAINIIFTVSPVRHVRDGIVENNLSKSRLLDAIHTLINKKPQSAIQYFPAYELVIDVLRDYRFYDKDLVHPNSIAADYVFERFADAYLDDTNSSTMNEINKWVISEAHRPFNENTAAYSEFRKKQKDKLEEMKKKYPFIKFD
jgi:lysophospholipase L1-like esterase